MAKEHPLLQELRELSPAYFRQLKYDPETTEYETSLHMRDYQHLMTTISDLLKLCIAVTEEEAEVYSPWVAHLDRSIHNTLELIVQLLPMHESEFMDHLLHYFNSDGEGEDGA
ncbi:hypothetical protein LS482_20890 [Sinomicrobium kalidii]|uniref:hypothetical protein n=1 Tax=Sinomicrobium kalidii TaxID=2900738 RepID=UPI001E3D2274|nr:hypothetical protein [Sinomicrobium kalidii]UGU16121.1 hypothetical protein LS482_20890 [Sinomicrobium kalidii]